MESTSDGDRKTTSNGEFTLEFLGHRTEGKLAEFTYEVCRLRSRDTPCHWILSLGQIGCLAERRTFWDLVVGATCDGRPLPLLNTADRGQASLGLDPVTRLDGITLNAGLDGRRGTACSRYTITFDTSMLRGGYALGTGAVVAAVCEAGRDVQGNDDVVFSFVCIPGPVCVPR